MFTTEQLKHLTPEQRQAIEAVVEALEGAGQIVLDDIDDEHLNEVLDLLSSESNPGGCVPDAYCEDVAMGIIKKFQGLYGAAKNLAMLRWAASPKSDSLPWMSNPLPWIWCDVQPSYEDCTHVVIYDDEHVYHSDYRKAWNLWFGTLGELADEVVGIAAGIEAKYRKFHHIPAKEQ